MSSPTIKPRSQDVELRKQRMIDSLPLYYVESPEVDAIMHANATEIERKRAEAADLEAQLFVRTATWGLDYWDRVLALDPAPRMPIEQRRERILAKLNGAAPATIAYLTDVVNVYVANKDTHIDEFPEEYRFDAVIPIDGGNEIITDDIRAAIEEVKPAHLQFTMTGSITDSITLESREYGFDVPYPITGMFRTDRAQGTGIAGGFTLGDSSYGFSIAYPITGEFTANK